MQEIYFSEILCDVTILAADKSFPCHRVVLASVSPYFKALFTSPMKESVAEEVDVLDIPSSVMWAIMHYIYTGEAWLTLDNVEEMYMVSNRLQVTAMINLSSSYLAKRIDHENCLWIYRLAHSHNDRILMDAVINHIGQNLSSLSEQEDFFHLEMEELVNILSADDLMVSSELAVYDLARCWWEFRTQDNPLPAELLKAIRLPLLNPEELERISMDIPSDDPPSQHPTRICLRKGMFEERIICMDTLALDGTNPKQADYHMNAYDPITDSWEKLPFCMNLIQFRFASEGCCLYVSGGYINHHGFSNALYVYDSVLNEWKELPPMKHPRAGHGFQAYKNKLYAFSGYNAELTDSVECFSVSDNSWHDVSNMPLALHSFTNTVHKGRLFAFGGIAQMDINCVRSQEYEGFQVYDVLTDTWSQFLLPIVFSCTGAVAMDDKLYIIVSSATTHGYNELLNKFTEGFSMDHLGRICRSTIPPVLDSISGSVFVRWKNRIYIMGGSGYGYRRQYKTYHWSPGESSWTLCKKELPFFFVDSGSVTLQVPLEHLCSIIPGRRSNYNFKSDDDNETGAFIELL